MDLANPAKTPGYRMGARDQAAIAAALRRIDQLEQASIGRDRDEVIDRHQAGDAAGAGLPAPATGQAPVAYADTPGTPDPGQDTPEYWRGVAQATGGEVRRLWEHIGHLGRQLAGIDAEPCDGK